MADFEIVLNGAGVRELLKSAEITGICQEKAQQIQRKCGEGYETDVYQGKTRVNAMVYAATDEARRDALDNDTVLRSLR